jgi:hypothetical protein
MDNVHNNQHTRNDSLLGSFRSVSPLQGPRRFSRRRVFTRCFQGNIRDTISVNDFVEGRGIPVLRRILTNCKSQSVTRSRAVPSHQLLPSPYWDYLFERMVRHVQRSELGETPTCSASSFTVKRPSQNSSFHSQEYFTNQRNERYSCDWIQQGLVWKSSSSCWRARARARCMASAANPVRP